MTDSTVLISLPLPPRELSPNARPHWAAKARAAKRYKQEAVNAYARQYGKKRQWRRAWIEIEWQHPTARLPDKDNIIAWLKSGIDGLVSAGLLSDDKEVDYASPQVTKAPAGCAPGVYLYVTGMDDADGPAEAVSAADDLS